MGEKCISRNIFVPITAVSRRQVDIGAGVVTVPGS